MLFVISIKMKDRLLQFEGERCVPAKWDSDQD